MRPSTFFGTAVLMASAFGHAHALDLKCSFADTAAGAEEWIGIDPQANIMRVGGEALPLVMTNDNYASRTPSVAGFVTIRRIDRHTGSLTVSTIRGAEVVRSRQGSCEPASPPATKF